MANCREPSSLERAMITPLKSLCSQLDIGELVKHGDRDTLFTQATVISSGCFAIGGIIYALLGLLQSNIVYALSCCIGYYCAAFVAWYSVVKGFGFKGNFLHDCFCLLLGAILVWLGVKVILKGMADYKIDHSIVKEVFLCAAGLLWICVGATATLPRTKNNIEATEQNDSKDTDYLQIVG